jgi:hypothetical protein
MRSRKVTNRALVTYRALVTLSGGGTGLGDGRAGGRRGDGRNLKRSTSAGQPVGQSASQPTNHSASQPTSQPTSQPVSQSVGQPANQSVCSGARPAGGVVMPAPGARATTAERIHKGRACVGAGSRWSACMSASRPVSLSVSQSVSQPISQSMSEQGPVTRALHQPWWSDSRAPPRLSEALDCSQVACRPVSQPFCQCQSAGSQPVSQLAGRIISKPISQLVSQSVGQQASSPISEPVG